MEKVTVKVDPKQADHGEPILVTVDPRALDCPLCFQTLRPPVFQCSAGHVVCSPCHDRLRDSRKCLVCSAATAYSRCYAVERILRSVRVACPNCDVQMFLHEREEHAKECTHSAVLQRGHGASLPADRFTLVLPEVACGSTTTITVSIGDRGSEALATEEDKSEKTKVMPLPGRYVPRWKRGSSA